MKDALIFNELWEIIEKIKSRPDNSKPKDQEDYDLRDGKALVLIRSSYMEEVYGHLETIDHSFKAWSKLKELFE